MEENTLQPRNDVIKHSAAIQIQNNITLLQRKAWNVLLAHAYDALLSESVHSISVSELCRILNFNSKNEAYLKESLRALVKCTVEWNILGKDEEYEWGTAALLAEALIKNGLVFYSYGAMFRERLYNPSIYARVSLSLQNEFESKHAQALWEICTDYLGARREYGETRWITVEEFRLLLGLVENQYPQFMRLNSKVIKPAIAEINKVSDLQVEVENQRQGRKVTALKFRIRRVTKLPGMDGKQSSLFPDLDDIPVAVRVLKDAGLSPDDAWKIWQDGFSGVVVDKRPAAIGDNPDAAFTQYIHEKIHLLKRLKEQGKVKNATGFLLQAIKQNYGNPEFKEESKTSESWKKFQTNLLKKKALEDQRLALQAEYDQKQMVLCEQIAREEPERLKDIMEALTEASSFNRSQYDLSKTPLQNYLATKGLRSLADEQLMHDCADRFDALRQSHRDELSTLDTEIEKVRALC